MHPLKTIRAAADYAFAAARWLPVAVLIGLIGGAVGAAFHHSIAWATAFRLSHHWVVWLLPVGAIVIELIYRLFRLPDTAGTNLVLESIRSTGHIPLTLAPVILLGTVLTHFFGGSAGREGAALQIGGSLASGVARLFRVEGTEEQNLMIICGMASVFSALFGTPATAAMFVIEVISVGRLIYSGMLPALTSALTAFGVSQLLGGEAVRMHLAFDGNLSAPLVLRIAFLALLGALLSIVFCVAVHRCSHLSAKWIQNPFLRSFLLGTLLLGMTLLSGGQEYNGAGMETVEQAVAGEHIVWYAFALKLLFTAVTLAAGYRGGEIVPVFFVGAAFGAAVGPLLGLDSGLAAAMGMVALFCGAVNCPVASIFLAVEIFGGRCLSLAAVTCAVSYLFSGYFGLYSSQHIVRSKVGTELIDRHAEE
ncbi:MAG: chloride channel protein [Oscillospiraceae bacterium]|nr:chloride channel protein [Oscillospiraceae bacterium]